MDHETAFIKTFVLPDKQSRWLELLSKAKRRHIFPHRLADDRDFDRKFKVELKPSQQNPEDVERILKLCGAPQVCHVISESSEADGRDMPLRKALKKYLAMDWEASFRAFLGGWPIPKVKCLAIGSSLRSNAEHNKAL